ncbi:MAG: hypothetical protein H7Y59_00950 [Anaerolineales bacterium]|nr:hypothetical protein [Anaerolineales bacterium]
MLTSSDLIHLPYTPDLTEGGIAYALRSLPYSFDRIGSKPYDRIRRVVAEVAVELAFRRYLSQQNIPFDIKSGTPFTEPDKYNVSLGGHRCDIRSFLISHRNQISQMRNDPSVMLNAPALVPSDRHAMDGHSDNELYLFAFLSGLIAASQTDLKKAIETSQPHYLIHVMPTEWRKPSHWNPLGPLVLKSESEEKMLVEVCGQDEARGFLTRRVILPAKTRVTVKDPFYSISAVHIKNMPSARLGIHSSAFKEAHVISPLEWGNIWVYGMDITLAGFISRGEFRKRAKMIAPNSRVFQYSHTKTKNLAIPVSRLNPLDDLFIRVREWASQK